MTKCNQEDEADRSQPNTRDAVPTDDAEVTVPKPKPRRKWKRYILVCFLVLMASGEIGLRIFADRNSRFNIFVGAYREWDPHRQARLQKNYRSGTIRINSKGFLGPEFEATKAPGSYRIVTLGDSCSFVPTSRNYPRALEELLGVRHSDRPIEIINASCPGYSSTQARIWYEEEVNDYEHDMLIIFLGWNDMGQYNPDGLAYKLGERGYLQEPSLLQRALLSCYLLRLGYVAQSYWERSRPVSFDALSEEDQSKYDRFYPTHFEDNLNRIIQLARAKGRTVYLLNYGCLVNESPTESEQSRMHFPRGMGRSLPKYLALIESYRTALYKVALETETTIIDIKSLFSTAESREVFSDSVHFNAEGAELIAARVAETVATLLDD